jgi:hypothetical protein
VSRIPAFLYLTDFRENTLKDLVTKLEPNLFKTVNEPLGFSCRLHVCDIAGWGVRVAA